MIRDEIVAAARDWLGTPYHHQGRLKGVGCDCLGLVASVGNGLGLLDYDIFDYPPQPDGKTLQARCRERLDEQPKGTRPQPGDIALMWMARRSLPQHLAIFVPWDSRIGIIHAHQRFDAVLAHSFDGFWAKRLVDLYSYRGVA